MPSMRVMCRRECETIAHLFSECDFAIQLYKRLTQVFALPAWNWRFILRRQQAQIWVVHKEGEMKSRELLLLAMFICWRERCSRIFTEKTKTLEDLIREVQEQWMHLQ